jgi:hypothetical protein
MRTNRAATMTKPDDRCPAEISDAELAALALAADPHQPLDANAVPFDFYLGQTVGNYLGQTVGNLPEWYMPPVMARRSRRARKLIVLAIIGAFLAIEAAGLCSTYGQLPFH